MITSVFSFMLKSSFGIKIYSRSWADVLFCYIGYIYMYWYIICMTHKD